MSLPILVPSVNSEGTFFLNRLACEAMLSLFYTRFRVLYLFEGAGEIGMVLEKRNGLNYK